jgi:hypothetical protein
MPEIWISHSIMNPCYRQSPFLQTQVSFLLTNSSPTSRHPITLEMLNTNIPGIIYSSAEYRPWSFANKLSTNAFSTNPDFLFSSLLNSFPVSYQRSPNFIFPFDSISSSLISSPPLPSRYSCDLISSHLTSRSTPQNPRSSLNNHQHGNRPAPCVSWIPRTRDVLSHSSCVPR